MPEILKLTNLSLQLAGAPPADLVKNVSFSLEEGKVLGIVGESGSGKTLTALSVTRLIPENIRISSGEIRYTFSNKTVDLNSISPENLREYRGKHIAMIFQEPMSSLNPSMSCGKQIEEAILAHQKMNHADLKEKVISLMMEADLPRPQSLYNAYPHQLSGGQRQRLMIAMALSSDPELLIADEPTTALDVTVQKNILLLLKRLQKTRKLSVIFISHDLRLVREIADDVLVMRKGEVAEYASVEDIFLNPKSAYTKGLLACQPSLNTGQDRLLTIKDFEEGGKPGKPEENPRNKIDYTVQPILKIEKLVVDYSMPGGMFSGKAKIFRAVNDVSLEIYPGETLGLVGESGCGKTTIGKTILKLIRSGQGSVCFKGENINKLSGSKLRNFRKSVQVVFQDPFASLNPRQTVGDMMNEAIRFHHPELKSTVRKDKIIEILTSVGMEEKDLIKYPHQFSGGQRQRICIARSLAPEPELLVLDESVSALDVSVQAQVLNLLNDIKQNFGLSYLFISHDLSVVKYMSDRIMVMRSGIIEEQGEAQKIFSHPETEYTRLLISSIPGNQYSSASTS